MNTLPAAPAATDISQAPLRSVSAQASDAPLGAQSAASGTLAAPPAFAQVWGLTHACLLESESEGGAETWALADASVQEGILTQTEQVLLGASVGEESRLWQTSDALPESLPSMGQLALLTQWLRKEEPTASGALEEASESGAMELLPDALGMQSLGKPPVGGLPERTADASYRIEREAAGGASMPSVPTTSSVAGGVEPVPARAASVDKLVKVETAATPSAAPQPMVQALAQRIQLQQAQGVDVATVRLDPPHLGVLEIRVQQDAGGVQVQLHASHSEVGRQLAAVAESLRQELQARSPGEAQVTVSAQRQSMAQGQGHREQQPQSEREAVIGQALYLGEEQAHT